MTYLQYIYTLDTELQSKSQQIYSLLKLIKNDQASYGTEPFVAVIKLNKEWLAVLGQLEEISRLINEQLVHPDDIVDYELLECCTEV